MITVSTEYFWSFFSFPLFKKYINLLNFSDGLLAICAVTAILSVVDLELYYMSRGTLVPPKQPAAWGVPCEYIWNGTNGGYGFKDNQGLSDFVKLGQFGVRILISFFTLITLVLVYWYSELERRLLVVKNHLSDNIGLFSSPLANNLVIELIVCAFHLPPGVNILKSEFQLITFVRLYNIVKV